MTYAIAAHGIEVVISLGAGLDARPWRLDLPPGLRWVEIDFPAILDYKHNRMASEEPKCRLERLPQDLNDAAQRRAIYANVGMAPGLLIAEGLLMYLPADMIAALATEPPETSGLHHFLMDVTSSEFARRSGTNGPVQHVRAETGLSGEQIHGLFERHGWAVLQRRSYVYDMFEAARKRLMKVIGARSASEPIQPPPTADVSGVYLLGRP